MPHARRGAPGADTDPTPTPRAKPSHGTSRRSCRRALRSPENPTTSALLHMRAAPRLVLATDPDREGEAIAWHVTQELQARRLRNL